MEFDPAIWSLASRALLVLAFITFALALRRQRREFAAQIAQVLAGQQQARVETQVIAEKLSALATLVAAIPARVERAPVEEAPPPRSRREASPVRSYETARRLARSGATVDEIVATCGVAGAEARLLRRLHGGASEQDNAA